MDYDHVRLERRTAEEAPSRYKGMPWILQGALYGLLGLALGLFARYIDLHPSTTLIYDLARSLSDLPFWMMIAIGVSVYSKNSLAAFFNVLLFFTFMDIAYYWYSFQFDGVMLKRLFVFWGAAGVAASFLAPFVHQAKKHNAFGAILSVAILAVQVILTGWSVFGLNLIWFVGSVVILHRKTFIGTIVMAGCAGLIGIGVWLYLRDIGVSSLLRHSDRQGNESDLMLWIKSVDIKGFLARHGVVW